MYYENIMTEIASLKKYVKQLSEEDRIKSMNSSELNMRKRVDALGSSGHNLAERYGIYDYKTLVKAIQTAVRSYDFSKIAVGDYLIAPTMTFNGTTYTNWRFDVTGICSYMNIGDSPSIVPGVSFTSHLTCFNAVWPDVNNAYMVSLGTNLETNSGVTLNTANHMYGQQRQSDWVANKVYLLAEQEVGNPQNTFTFGNGHSCQFLPLFKRAPIYRVKDSTPGTRNTWWLASRDAFIDTNTTPNCKDQSCYIRWFSTIESHFDNNSAELDHLFGVVPSFYL